jgi:uncharacterized membrane protein
MGHVSTRFHIDAPKVDVWEVAADCARIGEWNVSFVDVQNCSGRLDRVGAGYTAVVRVMGRRFETQWETTKVEPSKVLEEKATAPGGGHATVLSTFADGGAGTEVSVELDYTLPGGMFSGVLEKLAAGSVERDLRHSNENFKALCEAVAPVAAGSN